MDSIYQSINVGKPFKGKGQNSFSNNILNEEPRQLHNGSCRGSILNTLFSGNQL